MIINRICLENDLLPKYAIYIYIYIYICNTNEVVCTSLHTNTYEKDRNPSLLPPAIGK